MSAIRKLNFTFNPFFTHFILLVFSGIFLLFSNSCQKENFQGKLPVVETIDVSLVDENTAVSGGIIPNEEGEVITAKGVCWGTEINPEISTSSKTMDGEGFSSRFESTLTDLLPNTTYHVRAYATNASGTTYGKDISFNTTPLLTTLEVTSITSDSALCEGNVNSDGMALIIERGVYWSTLPYSTATWERKQRADSSGTGQFFCKIRNLEPYTTYYVRAYAKNPAGISYGNEVSFTTIAKVPYFTSSYSVSQITANEAWSGGNCYSDYRAPITAKGVCWDTEPNPSAELDTKTIDGDSTGAFTSYISGLTQGTKYYVRAYATNSSGIGYGYERSFTTPSNPPILTTIDISSITSTSAISGGNVTNEGGSQVTTKGVCWSTSPHPTTYDDYSYLYSTGTGVYSRSMTNLSPGTTYYVRAYAVNGTSNAYGNEISFTTSE